MAGEGVVYPATELLLKPRTPEQRVWEAICALDNMTHVRKKAPHIVGEIIGIEYIDEADITHEESLDFVTENHKDGILYVPRFTTRTLDDTEIADTAWQIFMDEGRVHTVDEAGHRSSTRREEKVAGFAEAIEGIIYRIRHDPDCKLWLANSEDSY